MHDLGSQNGTFIDGERVTKRALASSTEVRHDIELADVSPPTVRIEPGSRAYRDTPST